MTTKTLMTVEEYFLTSFEDGDCEYADGEILEKNMGEYGHADIQGELVFFRRSLRSKPGLSTLKAMPEVRIRTGPSRYRVPDVAVWFKGETGVRIPTLPREEGHLLFTIQAPRFGLRHASNRELHD